MPKKRSGYQSECEFLSDGWRGEDRTVDTHVKMLRNNLGQYRDKIVTVRGMGYKFEE